MVFKKKKSDWRDVVKYTTNTSGLLDDLPKQDSFEFLLEPTHVVSGSEQRILYVVDWVPSEDLSSPYKKLFSGVTGDLFYNVLNLAKSRFLKNIEVNRSSWRVTSFSAYRTVGKPKSFQENLKQTFLKRLHKTVIEYKPTVVVCLGHIASRYIMQDKYDLLGKIGPWLGVPLVRDFEHASKKHSCLFIASLSLTQAVTGKSEAMMLGYAARHMANALAGRHLYKVDDKALRNHKSVLIDTIGKFDKLMDVLESADAVSVDTETKNLNKVTNRMLTIQFAKCANFGYLVPIYHKDTPFSADELKYIVRRLKAFFEGKNHNKYHIYANAKFDLLTLRSTLKTQYFHNDLWDIFGGEFCFHPDTYVWTEQGQIRIADLVQLDCKPRVLSFNTETQDVEFKEILFTSQHETDEDMYEVEYEGGTLKVTGNHKLRSVTRSAYVRVDEICQDEEVLVLP